jgi:hypothetical protein
LEEVVVPELTAPAEVAVVVYGKLRLYLFHRVATLSQWERVELVITYILIQVEQEALQVLQVMMLRVALVQARLI